MGDSIATSSGADFATKNSVTTTFWQSDEFYWSQDNNKIVSGTTFACRLQYKNTRTSDANATAVITALDGWISSTVAGSAAEVSAIVSDYGAFTLTAPATTTTSLTTTTTTRAATIGLSLASIAAALVTIIAV